MAINITVVEQNWRDLVQDLKDGEYGADEFYPGCDENGDCYWGEQLCETCGEDPCRCDVQADENWDVLVEHAIYIQGGN